MSSVDTARLQTLVGELEAELRTVLAEQPELIEQVPLEDIQSLLASAIHLFVARRELGAEFAPVTEDAITATEAAVTTTELLKAVNIALFELTLWNGMGRI